MVLSCGRHAKPSKMRIFAVGALPTYHRHTRCDRVQGVSGKPYDYIWEVISNSGNTSHACMTWLPAIGMHCSSPCLPLHGHSCRPSGKDLPCLVIRCTQRATSSGTKPSSTRPQCSGTLWRPLGLARGGSGLGGSGGGGAEA